MIEALNESTVPNWLWEAYQLKLDASFSPASTFYGPGFSAQAGGTDSEIVQRWIVALDIMPDGEQFTHDHPNVFRDWLSNEQLTAAAKESVRIWLLRCNSSSNQAVMPRTAMAIPILQMRNKDGSLATRVAEAA